MIRKGICKAELLLKKLNVLRNALGADNSLRYKRLKNRLKSDILVAKLTYLSSLLQQSRKNLAKLWSEVCEVIG